MAEAQYEEEAVRHETQEAVQHVMMTAEEAVREKPVRIALWWWRSAPFLPLPFLLLLFRRRRRHRQRHQQA